MRFLDRARIHIRSGAGGAGSLSFRREKFVEFGGPDGGVGGRGGHVYAETTEGLNTLVDYRYRQHFKADTGGHGMGKNRTGAAGDDVVIPVPVGTEVLEEDEETLIADLTEPGQRVLLAKGGNGGFGNARFKSSRNQAPRRANPGQLPEERTVWLRLKLLADVGLVGLPNAGKSTFLAAASAARPKIADYPFTTLVPQLGVVRIGPQESFVLADIPGLIEGASRGAGIGDRFLGHVERCAALLHLVDGTGEDVATAYRTVRAEMDAYEGGAAGLTEKPELVALSKADALGPEQTEAQRAALAEASGTEVLVVSAAAGSGLTEVLGRLMTMVRARRAEEAAPPEEAEAWRP